MYELSINSYSKAIPFINNIADEIVYVRSVVEKMQKGTIYVDDIVNPNVCLIHHYCGLGFLAGTTEIKSFNDMLVNMFYKRFNNNQRNLRLIVSSDTWQNKLKELFGENIVYFSNIESNLIIEHNKEVERLNLLSNDHIIAWTRVKFKLNKELFVRIIDNLEVPEGFLIKRIDENVISSIKGSIVPSFSWDSDEVFLKKGFGYCLVDGGNVVSTCFSAFISQDKIDIGIETSPEYRGKGYGLITGAAMINHCLKEGFEPVWCCRQDNIGSFSVAKKLGFVDILYLPLYCSVK